MNLKNIHTLPGKTGISAGPLVKRKTGNLKWKCVQQ